LGWRYTEKYEYRVFVPPPPITEEEKELKIAAISQYAWHTSFYTSSPAEIKSITSKVYQGISSLFTEIIDIIKCSTDDEQGLKRLLETGFAFDVVSDRDGGHVRFIEVNSFGAMTGCGSCLFHWVRDGKIVYGVDEGAEIRLTL
jgi:hypothetical protein